MRQNVYDIAVNADSCDISLSTAPVTSLSPIDEEYDEWDDDDDDDDDDD